MMATPGTMVIMRPAVPVAAGYGKKGNQHIDHGRGVLFIRAMAIGCRIIHQYVEYSGVFKVRI